MADKDKRLKARLPRGFADRSAADIRATERMVATIRRVYERYGFEPVETPLIEYTERSASSCPTRTGRTRACSRSRMRHDRDDGEWLSLRYDLTAPLARYVAENYERLPKPYRSYRSGWVFRNEKPGPGRFRQFMQFDADTVGAASPAADAEMCMMAADTMEALGIPRGQYVIKVNSRKVLDGVMEAIGVADERQRLTVLRAIDKLDRLGIDGVRQLLGPGRKDESGDFTKGAGLDPHQIATTLEDAGGRGSRAATIRARPPLGREGRDGTRADRGACRAPPATGPTASASTPPSSAASSTTPARSSRRSCSPKSRTRRASRSCSARSAAAGATTGSSAASWRRTCRRPASPSACRACRRRSPRSASSATPEAAGPVVVLVMDKDRIGDYQRWSPISATPTSPPSSTSAPPA